MLYSMAYVPALRMTRASSRNVGKVSEFKLVLESYFLSFMQDPAEKPPLDDVCTIIEITRLILKGQGNIRNVWTLLLK